MLWLIGAGTFSRNLHHGRLEAAENAGNAFAHVGAWAIEALSEVHP
jgi:hypothetical protein